MGKRVFDFLASAVVIVLGVPLWLMAAVAIELDSPGPVLHRATRVGRCARPFTLLKFRTMVVGAAGMGPGITQRTDPRITRVGRILRRLKIDELPQFINVLCGEMSIVGPRPEDPQYVARYTPEQRYVLAVRPGITSPAAIKYRHEEVMLATAGDQLESVYLGTILPEKLRLDLEYISQQSFLHDLSIIARTAGCLFAGRGRPGEQATPTVAAQPAGLRNGRPHPTEADTIASGKPYPNKEPPP